MLTGRFETMDPGKSESCCALRASQAGDIFNPATLHKYVYAASNPVNKIDPSGRGFLEENVFSSEVLLRTYLALSHATRVAWSDPNSAQHARPCGQWRIQTPLSNRSWRMKRLVCRIWFPNGTQFRIMIWS
jgi:hypothetical protein